ncbi:hypothetical protein AR540_03105 [Pseudomonas sp. EpS/L25]|nr:hypothetical protein AR540_03105 [Pseudomonas sp. EpS/L25]
MNTVILAIDFSSFSQCILAVDLAPFGRGGEGNFREMQVNGVEHYRGACSLADLRFMLEHDTTVVGPLIAVAQPVICWGRSFIGWLAAINQGAISYGSDRKTLGSFLRGGQMDTAVPVQIETQGEAAVSRHSALHGSVDESFVAFLAYRSGEEWGANQHSAYLGPFVFVKVQSESG